MIFATLLVIHVLICVGLIVVVLLQSSKGEGLAGAFGGGGGGLSGAVFGGRGAASFLSRATTVLAVVFMSSCLILSLLSARGRDTTGVPTRESAVTGAARETQQPMPQQTAPIDQAPGAGQTDQGAANPEDIFNTGGETEAQPADSQ